MVAAFVRTQSNTFIKSAGTTNIAVNTGVNPVPAGNLLVAAILFDNAGTASKPVVSSIGKQAGETNNWVFLGAARSTSTSAGAFASGELWAIKTTVTWPISQTYVVTLDTSVTMKAAVLFEFSGAEVTLRSTVGTAYSTTTTAAVASSSGTAPVVGDLAVGFLFGSNVAAAQAGDPDNVGGNWSTAVGVGSTGGSGTTNNFGVTQYKVVTATTHQSYDNSVAMTAGNGSIVAILQATVGGPAEVGTATLSGSGDLTTTQVPGPTPAAALSGGGTLSTTGQPKPVQTAALSGDGSLTSTQKPSVSTTAVLSGDGVLAAAGVMGTPEVIATIVSRMRIGGVPVGSPVTHTLSTNSSNVYAEFTVSGLSLAQLQSGTITIQHIVTRANSTTPATVYVDSVELLADYQTVTPPGISAFTGTATLSGDGSLTTIQVPRPVVTAGFTGGGSLTTTQAPKPIVSAALSGDGSLTTTQALAPVQVAALSGSGTLTTTQAVKPVQTVALSGSGTLSTTQKPTAVGTATLSGDGTLAAVGVPLGGAVGTATLSGDGALTTTQAPRPTGIAALSGAGTLSTVTLVTAIGTATLTGAGTLTTVQVPRPTGVAVLSGSGTLATLQVPRPTGLATLSGDGTLSTTQRITVVGVATLSGSGTLFAVGITAGQVAFVGSGSLTTTQVVVVTTTAVLNGSGALTTAGVPRITGIAVLSGSGTLTTLAIPKPTGVASLSGIGVLTTAIVLGVARAAALSGTGVLSAVGLPFEQVEFGWTFGLPFR